MVGTFSLLKPFYKEDRKSWTYDFLYNTKIFGWNKTMLRSRIFSSKVYWNFTEHKFQKKTIK